MSRTSIQVVRTRMCSRARNRYRLSVSVSPGWQGAHRPIKNRPSGFLDFLFREQMKWRLRSRPSGPRRYEVICSVRSHPNGIALLSFCIVLIRDCAPRFVARSARVVTGAYRRYCLLRVRWFHSFPSSRLPASSQPFKSRVY